MRYARLQVAPEAVQQQLNKVDASLLAFFDLDSMLVTVMMDGQAFRAIRTPMPVGWTDSLVDFRRLIEGRAPPQQIGRLGHFLYTLLWQPFEKHLKEKVIIIPDGRLHYLNFETLLYEQANSPDFARWPWLIKKHHIYYRKDLPVGEKNGGKNRYKILGLAPGFSSGLKEQYRQDLPGDSPPDSVFISWLRTPWSVDFVRQFQASGKVLIGKDASEENFRRYASEFDIIHLATHAQLQDENPLLSFMALTPQPQAGQDGYLYAYELYNQPLKAQLAVLTACQTGLGVYKKGQGVLSLAHAFQYAGCPNVVYSLWSIDDQQSNWLMEHFYAHLDRKSSFSQALRQAKLDYLAAHSGDLAAPFYWGGMVLTGENNSPTGHFLFFKKYWWGLILLSLVTFLFLFFRKNK